MTAIDSSTTATNLTQDEKRRILDDPVELAKQISTSDRKEVNGIRLIVYADTARIEQFKAGVVATTPAEQDLWTKNIQAALRCLRYIRAPRMRVVYTANSDPATLYPLIENFFTNSDRTC